MIILMISDIQSLKKEIRFRGTRRGIKELDLIFGRFIDTNLASLSEMELTQFRDLLIETDLDIFSWLQGDSPLPERFDNTLWQKIIAS